jgi:membrane protease YdiL (CAAX protease family)
MPDVLRLLKGNRWTIAMVVFTAAVYVMLALPERQADPAHRRTQTTEQVRASKEGLRLREERFQKVLEGNPRLFGRLAVAFMGVLLLGLFTDVVLATKRLKKKPWIVHGDPQRDVPWGLDAVLRVFILLFFLEAAILSLEMVASLFWDMRSLNRDLLLMLNSLVRDAIAVGAILWIVTRRYGTLLSDIGLTTRNFFKNVRTGLTAYVAIVPPLLLVLFAMAFFAKTFSYEPPPQPVVEMYIREHAPKTIVFFTLFVAICGPVMEELFFRGFAYKALRTRYGVTVAMTVTALFFATLHMNVLAFVPIFLLGLFLNYLYEKTGSLIPGMAAHMTHNLVMVGCTLVFKSISA